LGSKGRSGRGRGNLGRIGASSSGLDAGSRLCQGSAPLRRYQDSSSHLSVRALDLLRGIVVGESVTEPAAAVAFLRDDGAGALAGVEAAAARATVRVGRARASDKLRARRQARQYGGGCHERDWKDRSDVRQAKKKQRRTVDENEHAENGDGHSRE
jgi:hypothetical protein